MCQQLPKLYLTPEEVVSMLRSERLTIIRSSLAIVAVFIGWYFMANATSSSKAINAAKDAGYSQVRIVNSTIWAVELRGCGDKDTKRFTVTGVNAQGEQRTFYVCASLLKGGTVRSR